MSRGFIAISTDELLHKRFLARALLPHDLADRVLHAAGFRMVALDSDATELLLQKTVERPDGDVRFFPGGGTDFTTHCMYSKPKGSDPMRGDHRVVLYRATHMWLYVLPHEYTVHSEQRQVHFCVKGVTYKIATGGTNVISKIISESDLAAVCALVRDCPCCADVVELTVDGGNMTVVTGPY